MNLADIIKTTGTRADGVSLLLGHQKVNLPAARGQTRNSRRDVYRVRFDVENDRITGEIYRKEETPPWTRVVFQEEGKLWIAVDAVRTENAPIGQLQDLFSQGEYLSQAELLRIFECYPKESIKAYAAARELKLRFQHSTGIERNWVECLDCATHYFPESNNFLFRTLGSKCPACEINVRVRVVDASEVSKEDRIHRTERATEALRQLQADSLQRPDPRPKKKSGKQDPRRRFV